MKNLKIGTMCRLNSNIRNYTELIGEIVTVISSPHYDFEMGWTVVGIDAPWLSTWVDAVCEINCLDPIDDDGKQEVGSWEDCIWKPKVLERIDEIQKITN